MNATQQALDVCQGKMPEIKNWDGSTFEPTTPSSVFVALQYEPKQQASATEIGRPWLIAEFEADTAEVLRAVTVDDDDDRFPALSANLVRMVQGVRIPGFPPDPGCRDDPTLCYPFIAAVVLNTNQAIADAHKEAEACF